MYQCTNQNGFTLIEAMIALGIFAIGFLAVASMQVSALNSTTSSRKTTEAMELATQKAEELQGVEFYPDYNETSFDPEDRFAFSADLTELADDKAHTEETGIYTIEWKVEDDEPLDPISNDFTSPLPSPNEVTISKTVTIRVYETRNPGRIMADLELIRVWEQEG